MAEYIEREALKGAFQDIDAGRRDGWATSLSPEEAADYLAEYLDDIPAVDVAPVRHGRWYSRGGRFRCSVCDNKAFLKDIGGTGGWSHEYEQQKSPYCPNCGAKMDGGNDNDR